MANKEVKPYNNSKSEEIIAWCPSYLPLHLNSAHGIRVTNVPNCRYGGECFNAHAKEQIKTKTNISHWNRSDKSDVNLYKMQSNVKSVLLTARDTIYNPKYASKISEIKLDSMSFPELLAFWYDIACNQRRVAKKLPSRRHWKSSIQPPIVEGYRFQEDVPQCFLENEGDVWALERTLHFCPKYKHLINNKTIVHDSFNLCYGDCNCKHGVHEKENEACIPNMITGVCDCPTQAELDFASIIIEEENQTINTSIESLKKQLNSSVDEEGFTIKLSAKVRTKLAEDIKNLESQIKDSKLVRKMHYTEQGIIPLSRQIEILTMEKKSDELTAKEGKKPVRLLKKKDYSTAESVSA